MFSLINDGSFLNAEQQIARINASGRPIVIYGAGGDARNISKLPLCNIEAFCVDAPYHREGMHIDGRKVVSIESIMSDIDKYSIVIGFCDVNKMKSLAGSGFLNRDNVYFIMNPLYRDFGEYTPEFVKENIHQFEETYHLLCDGPSRETLVSYVNARISGNHMDLYDACTDSAEYFNDLTANLDGNERFVDCGAFDGDTIEHLSAFTHGTFEKAWALEPDKANFIALQERISSRGWDNKVVPVNMGAWEYDDILSFSSSGDQASSVSKHGKEVIHVTSVDHVVGHEAVTFIKMDIEGCELKALAGARNTIQRCMPKLAICVYHRIDDLIRIPRFIRSIENAQTRKKYKYYLRHHEYKSTGLVWYAIPD